MREGEQSHLDYHKHVKLCVLVTVTEKYLTTRHSLWNKLDQQKNNVIHAQVTTCPLSHWQELKVINCSSSANAWRSLLWQNYYFHSSIICKILYSVAGGVDICSVLSLFSLVSRWETKQTVFNTVGCILNGGQTTNRIYVGCLNNWM